MEIPPTTEESSNYDPGIAAYERGHYEMAIYDFEQRAVRGDPVAQFCLGYMYKHGKGVPPNPQKAIEWYTKAAQQNYTPAQNDLGVMYGRIAEQALLLGDESGITNFKHAMEWFSDAGGQGNPTALFNAGLMCRLFATLSTDSTEAIELYRRVVNCIKVAASRNYAPAQNELAEIYRDGLVVVQC